MATTIRVSPEKLVSASKRVEELARQYFDTYRRIQDLVDDLDGRWDGQGNDVYVNQLRGFNDDFERMFNLLNRFAAFLDQSARRYQSADAELAEKASKLSTGK